MERERGWLYGKKSQEGLCGYKVGCVDKAQEGLCRQGGGADWTRSRKGMSSVQQRVCAA